MDQLAEFSGLVDLAAERVGGKTLLASDEFFAEKENLLKPGRGMFIPEKFTDRGKWMDGWETRRKRTAGYDWCIIRLGLPGIVKGLDIDTNHFVGNSPAYASIDACAVTADATGEQLASDASVWTELLGRSPIRPGSQNLFAVANGKRWTHIRLNIYPDGGVARLRLYGDVAPDWNSLKQGEAVDLAAIENGGMVVAASDMFFGSRENLIMPGRASGMADGWETKRRRGPGYDWTIIRLGRPGLVKKVEVDTGCFKGNYPDACSLDACHEPTRIVDALTWSEVKWNELMTKAKLQADTRHSFETELIEVGPVTHIRLNIYPDGGVSRLRCWCTIELET